MGQNQRLPVVIEDHTKLAAERGHFEIVNNGCEPSADCTGPNATEYSELYFLKWREANGYDWTSLHLRRSYWIGSLASPSMGQVEQVPMGNQIHATMPPEEVTLACPSGQRTAGVGRTTWYVRE